MAEIWFVIILIWAMELFVFLLLFVALWSESVFKLAVYDIRCP